MSEDSIRNINLGQSETIHQVEQTADKPMKRKKKRRDYKPKREKDSLELTSINAQMLETSIQEEPIDTDSNDEKQEQQISINILVK
tara:strand:+ start:28225 stop:28482 length:258 start_codon:yes stop_codon:yes gene_type:complete